MAYIDKAARKHVQHASLAQRIREAVRATPLHMFATSGV